jgi:hypothetical protein
MGCGDRNGRRGAERGEVWLHSQSTDGADARRHQRHRQPRGNKRATASTLVLLTMSRGPPVDAERRLTDVGVGVRPLSGWPLAIWMLVRIRIRRGGHSS